METAVAAAVVATIVAVAVAVAFFLPHLHFSLLLATGILLLLLAYIADISQSRQSRRECKFFK